MFFSRQTTFRSILIDNALSLLLSARVSRIHFLRVQHATVETTFIYAFHNA